MNTLPTHVVETGSDRRDSHIFGILRVLRNGLHRIISALVAILMVTVVIITLIGVVFRYVLHHSLVWTPEISIFAEAWLVFLGVTLLFDTDGHPAITILTDRLSGRVAIATVVLREALIGTYIGVLILSGYLLVSQPHAPHSSALGIPESVGYGAVLAAGVVLAVQWLSRQFTTQAPRLALIAVILGVAGSVAVIEAYAGGIAVIYFVPLALVWILLPILFGVGIPIAIVLGLFSSVMIAFEGGVPLSIVTARVYAGVDEPSLLAIPAFMLTGALMLELGIADKLIGFAAALTGRFIGGLALTDVVASVFFADISGSAVADTAAIGSVMMPGMRRRGYSEGFAAAHQAASGAAGTLFPPSISMIIYATVASVSVTSLFARSLIPGIILVLVYMLVAYIISKRAGYPREDRATPRVVGKSFISAGPALFAIVVVLGGILGGVFTATEAGAVAAGYVFIVGFISNPKRSPKVYVKALVSASETTSMVMFIIANATIMAWMMIGLELPQNIASSLGQLTSDRIGLMLLLSGMLIVLAIFLEPPAILVAVVPIILPLTMEASIDPINLGVMLMLTTAVGMILPPIGICLLVSVSVLGIPVERAVRPAIPYMIGAIAVLVLVIVAPGILTLFG